MIISFPAWIAAWTDGDRRRRPWRAVTKRSVIAVRLLDRRYQLQGETARQKRRVQAEPPTRHYYTCLIGAISCKGKRLLLYLPALTFTRESQDFVIKDPNTFEDVPNISEDVPN